MTPETHEALGRVIAFLDAFEDEAHPGGAISTLRTEGLRLTSADLRTLLAAVDPAPVIEWGTRLRCRNIDRVTPWPDERTARAQLPPTRDHTLVHRYTVRRPDDVSEWIEGEPTAQEGQP